MKKENKILPIILVMALMVTIGILSLSSVSAGTSQEQTTASNATVNVFVEISLSSRLTANGIAFGNLDANTNGNNASSNYNATSMTEYAVTAGAANSVSIDLCIKDNVPLTKGGDTIPNAGYKYNFTSTNTASYPGLPGTAISTSYVKTQHTSIAASGVSYARFWLDIPGAQPAGTYSNTVSVKGIETGQSC